MGIRTLNPPAKARRSSEPVLSEADKKAVIKALQNGEFPGPDEDFDSMKAARRVIARWVREVGDAVDFKVGTRVWQDGDKYFAALRVIESE